MLYLCVEVCSIHYYDRGVIPEFMISLERYYGVYNLSCVFESLKNVHNMLCCFRAMETRQVAEKRSTFRSRLIMYIFPVICVNARLIVPLVV